MAIKKKSGSGSKESVVKKKKVSAGVTKSPVKKIRPDKKASAKHDTEKKT
jgi:hypothetical protein